MALQSLMQLWLLLDRGLCLCKAASASIPANGRFWTLVCVGRAASASLERWLVRCRLGYGFCWLLMLATLRHLASDFLFVVTANDRVCPSCVANGRWIIILRGIARCIRGLSCCTLQVSTRSALLELVDRIIIIV